MSDLDRLFRELVRTIHTKFPQYVSAPFEVGELYQTILPYRHHRRELGFETNQDYEMALTEILSGAGDYLIVDERLRDALRRELSSRNPDPAAFREHASAQVALNPQAVARISGAAPAPSPAATAAPVAAPSPGAPPPVAPSPAAPRPPQPGPARSSTPAATAGVRSTPTALEGRTSVTVTPVAGESCRYCGGPLPAGRRITFCPHCGENLTVVHCPACGTELEVGWKFCTTCGRPANVK